MSDSTKSKAQLIDELQALRAHLPQPASEKSSLPIRNLYQTVFDTMPDLVMVLDTEHNIVLMNRAMAGRLGTTPEACVGQKCYTALHDTDCPPEGCPHALLLADGQEHTAETFEERLGGYCLMTASPLKDAQGNTVGCVHIARDINQQKRTEQDLHTSETRFRAITENTTDLTIIVDTEGNYQYVSPSCQQIVGFKPDEILRKNRRQFVHPEDLPAVHEVVLRAIRRPGKTVSIPHYRAQHRDGHWVHLEALVTSMLDIPGIHGIVSNCRDITKRILAEEQLTRYQDQLEELIEQRTRELEDSREQVRVSERLTSIGTLAAGMAHEINNPVGTILLAAQNIREMLKRPDRHELVEDCLRGIIADADRCSDTIRNVMQFARRQTSPKRTVDVNTVITQAVSLTRKYIQDHNGTAHLELDPHLPAVRVNPIEIKQVLVQTIKNAVEARVGKLDIHITTSQSANGVQISVQDNGRGISPDHLHRIFDPFFTTRRDQGHTGLGLSVVHGIIQEHGGHIEIASEPGRGTTFTVHLPATTNSAAEGANGESTHR